MERTEIGGRWYPGEVQLAEKSAPFPAFHGPNCEENLNNRLIFFIFKFCFFHFLFVLFLVGKESREEFNETKMSFFVLLFFQGPRG